MKRERIDKLLVERGLVSSRTTAQALVMAGAVLADEQRVNKPSDLIADNAVLRIKGASDPAAAYVGRGGVKLAAALREFKIDVRDLVCLDIGASTGGFTDCLLQHGARRVVALDVGHNQLAWRLRNDPRVESREGVNARYLKREDFHESFDLIVVDVAFISVTKVMPAIPPLLKPEASVIVLIKPQFEVGRGEVGKGGIVREPEKRERVIAEVNAAARELGFTVEGLIHSPLHGADGNIEFLALYKLAPSRGGRVSAPA